MDDDLLAELQEALFTLLGTCSTVMDEDPFQSPQAMAMSLRRIQKATIRARRAALAFPIIGRGDHQPARSVSDGVDEPQGERT